MDWERFNQLVALSDVGRGEEALNGLRRLISASESQEDNASVLLIIGACQKEMGQFDQARNTFAEARSLADRDSWVHPRALFFGASIDVIQGKWKSALPKLDTVIRNYRSIISQPEHHDLYEETQRYRGMALYELGKPTEARPLLEEAATEEYDRSRTLYYLGRCCYDLGDLDRAKDSLREALKLDLQPVCKPSAHYVLGLAYFWLGQSAWAVPEFEWCLEHDTQRLVQKWKVLTALVNAAKALGIQKDVDRYSKMLRELQST
jgi:tetratricopeptide (TPR) repeat protein